MPASLLRRMKLGDLHPLLLIAMAGLAGMVLPLAGGVALGYALRSASSGIRLGAACDHVVERLLVTRDPVELERARIVIDRLNCDVARRLRAWPPSRTGGLTP